MAREIVDTSTGEVCNDICKDNSFKRLYNAPWYATLYVELYALFHDKEHLKVACRIVRRFYADGGRDFYTIEMPMVRLCKSLSAAGMESEAGEMRSLFASHADRLCERALDFPSSEVNYEQSIVAPACDIMLSAYSLTGEKRYLDMGRKMLTVLEMFNGFQSDYHTHEVAIRHWDGYWFGKARQLGDTFPHYWSALTGVVFKEYALIAGLDTTESEAYMRRAEDSMRAVLTMIQAGGRASCAYIFPDSVNGTKGRFWDAMANDQDWGLYIYIREHGQGKAK